MATTLDYSRFSDRARRAMRSANTAAQRFNHEWIRPEHILLGITADSGVAPMILANLGALPRAVAIAVENAMDRGPDMVTMGKLPMDGPAKSVVAFAVDAAKELRHGYVGTEHLLLGLLRHGDNLAARTLGTFGVTDDAAKVEMLRVLAPDEKKEPNVPEMPEKPSDADFAAARKWTSQSDFDVSAMERARAKGVLRWFIARQPVEVPEDVAEAAHVVAHHDAVGRDEQKLVARWVLSQVSYPPAPEPPKPRAVWRLRPNRESGNTRWELYVGDELAAGVFHELRDDAPIWRATDFEGADNYIPDLAAAKRRAEELAGVTTEEGPAVAQCLDVIRDSMTDRDFRPEEAAAYQRAMERPVSTVEATPAPLTAAEARRVAIQTHEDAEALMRKDREREMGDEPAPQPATIVLPEPDPSGSHVWPDLSRVFPSGSLPGEWCAYVVGRVLGYFATKELAAAALRDAGFGPGAGATTNGGAT